MRDHAGRRKERGGGLSPRAVPSADPEGVGPCCLLLLAAAWVLGACAAEDGEAGIDAFTLHRNLYAAGRFEIVAPAGPLLDRAEALGEFLETLTGFSSSVHAPGDGRGDPGAVRLVLGLVGEERIRRLAAPVGLEVVEGGFWILGRLHPDPVDRFVAAFADPDRPGLPMVLWAGLDADSLARSISFVPAPWSPRLVSVRGGGPGLEMSLMLDGRPAAEAPLDHAEARRSREDAGEDTILEGAGIRLHLPPTVPLPLARSYLQRARRALSRAKGWFGTSREGPAIEVFVHGTASSMFAEAGEVSLSRVDPITARVDILLVPGLAGDDGAGVVESFVRSELGDPSEPWLARALGTAAAESWWGRPLGEWCARLQYAGLVRDPSKLFDARAGGRVEEHVREPARGLLLARLCRGKAGRAAFRDAWRGIRPLPAQTELLSEQELAAFRPRLRRECREHVDRSLPAGLRGDEAGAPGSARIGRGVMLLALGGEQVLDDLPERIDEARAAGADLLAVTVQASRSPQSTALRVSSELFTSSPDAEVAEILARASEAGMRTVLCTEPLASPSGTWSDGGKLVEVESTSRFFNGFRRVSTHYALLAELLGTDILSLGSGLTTASRTQEDPSDSEWMRAAKRERLRGWRALIASVRPLFDGALTYASGTPSESRGIAFFGDLDLVGLWLFPSLERTGAPVTEERDNQVIRSRLRHALEEARSLGDEVGKPVIVLGIGYPAMSGSLAAPGIPAGKPDVELQDRVYQRLGEAIGLNSESELPQGIVLWNFGSDLARENGPEGSSYSPRGLPAAERLPRILRGKRP